MPRTLRDKVRAFQIVAPLCAASGSASANPQFGSGGAIQYYVSPADVDKLRPAAIAPLSQESVVVTLRARFSIEREALPDGVRWRAPEGPHHAREELSQQVTRSNS